MKDECQVAKLLKFYPVDYTLLASEMSDNDIQTLCVLYGLQEGEFLLAFYGCVGLRSFPHGVVMTDRRLVAGQGKLSGNEMNLESFTWDELRFVMDDIKTSSLSANVKLPDGRYFKVNLSSGKFHELMKKVAPALEGFQGESGIKVTLGQELSARKSREEIREEDARQDEANIASGIKTLKWSLIVVGALVCFVLAGKAYQFIQGATQSRGQFTDREICQAGIALTSRKSLSEINIGGASKDFYRYSYVRAMDNSRWGFRCKVEGDRVVWATTDGPWRTRDSDWPIFWTVNKAGDVLGVVEDYGDGSTNFKKHRKSDF